MIEAFGVLDGTQEVQAITLGVKGGLQAQVLTFGGILRRLVFPSRGAPRELIITLPDLDSVPARHHVPGSSRGPRRRIESAERASISRVASIGSTANEGPNQLHGGHLGFGKRLWRVLGLQNAPRHRLLLGLSLVGWRRRLSRQSRSDGRSSPSMAASCACSSKLTVTQRRP